MQSERSGTGAKEAFVREIEERILSGEWEIGQSLPSERALAAQFGISKTAVHEGVCDMQRKGFLDVAPRRGIFVGDYAQNGTLEALTSIMNYGGRSLNERNVQSFLEMRCAIESLALRRVIDAGDAAVGERLRELAQEAVSLAAQPQPDHAALGELCFAFHHFICVASGNTLAPLIFNAFRALSVTFWTKASQALGAEESARRLAAFAQSVRERDIQTALALLREITETSAQLVRGA